LHTDNGREFENKYVHALCKDWNIKLVHGQPRKSSTQGSVVRENQYIENIIMTWQGSTQRNDWANNFKLFQLIKNNSF
jgi:transposase InsO family protein